MAKLTDVSLFLGTDFSYVFSILNDGETAAVNILNWTISWMLKEDVNDADASALLTLTTASAIVVSGTYNSVPATNTQVATVTIADTDTTSLEPMQAVWELKRTDAGLETVLAYGRIELLRAVHR